VLKNAKAYTAVEFTSQQEAFSIEIGGMPWLVTPKMKGRAA
jgi:hypothetical protein